MTPEQRKKKNAAQRRWYHKNKLSLTKEQLDKKKAQARRNSLRYVKNNKKKYDLYIKNWRARNKEHLKKYLHERYLKLRGLSSLQRKKLIKDRKLELTKREKIKYNFNCKPIKNIVIKEKALGVIERKSIIIEW